MKNRRRTIESFELLTRVEVSPMGSVYVALDGLAAQTPVLLWVFDREDMVGSASLRGLASPGDSPIPNPCLAEFVRSGLHRDTAFAAYERLPGLSLSEIMQRCAEVDARMPADLALLITCGIAAALETSSTGTAEATASHGCLSPYFVLLMDNGPACLFGYELAPALIDWDRAHEQRTPLSRYLAPEVRLGSTPDASSDVYSLGSILFELLTGRPLPLEAPERLALIESEADSETLPGGVASLIRQSLVDQAERWPDASAWKRRARKIMHSHDYQPSSETQESFLYSLYNDQRTMAIRPLSKVTTPAAEVEEAVVVPALSKDECAEIATVSFEPLAVNHEPADPAYDLHVEAVSAAAPLALEANDNENPSDNETGPIEPVVAVQQSETADDPRGDSPRDATLQAQEGGETATECLETGPIQPFATALEPLPEPNPEPVPEPLSEPAPRSEPVVEYPLPTPIAPRTRGTSRIKKGYLGLAAAVVAAAALSYLLLSSVLPATDAPVAKDHLAEAQESPRVAVSAAEQQPAHRRDASTRRVEHPAAPAESPTEPVPQPPRTDRPTAAPEPSTPLTPTVAPASEPAMSVAEPVSLRAEPSSESESDERRITAAVQQSTLADDAPGVAADTGFADTRLVDTGLADTGLADSRLADSGLTETGPDDSEQSAIVTNRLPAGGEKIASTETVADATLEPSAPLRDVSSAPAQLTPTPASRVTSTEPTARAAVVPEAVVIEPELLKINPPTYPLKARRMGLEGTVLVNAYVTPQGDVGDVELVEGLGGKSGIDAAALKAVRTARFRAGSRQGVATAMWHTVAVSFQLDD